MTENENMAESIVRMFHRMRGKVAKNTHIDWWETPVWQAEAPRFIYDGETVHSFALFDKKPEHGPTLSWRSGETDYKDKVDQIEVFNNGDLARLGRACQMRESASDSEKLSIALKYQLVSKFTSLILVYERNEDDKIKGVPNVQQVPQMRAYGHGNYNTNSLVGGAICHAFMNCSDRIISNKSIGILPFVPPIQNMLSLSNKLIELWKKKVLQIASLANFISLVKQEKKFATLNNRVMLIVKQTGFPEENVWANFIACLLEEKGKLERHDERLLKPFLYNGAEKKKFESALNMSNTFFNLPLVISGL